jgi:hypothetical protein
MTLPLALMLSKTSCLTARLAQQDTTAQEQQDVLDVAPPEAAAQDQPSDTPTMPTFSAMCNPMGCNIWFLSQHMVASVQQSYFQNQKELMV